MRDHDKFLQILIPVYDVYVYDNSMMISMFALDIITLDPSQTVAAGPDEKLSSDSLYF